MLRCGLLGKTLAHSYSPEIHSMLADYEYLLYEKAETELEAFLRTGGWDGLNVTIPYKKAVVPFLDELSDTARAICSVNTIVRRSDGRLFGDNTDYYGFLKLVETSGISVSGKKALVLGSGGASVCVCGALRSLGAKPVVISRSGENNYSNLDRHADARIIVNTTPLGMYPNNGVAAVDLNKFPSCDGVLDIVYNPARTALLLQAESLGIPHRNGLYMLVAQAKRSCELFTGNSIDDGSIERICSSLAKKMRNIVLIGMPGSGKSTVARELGRLTSRPVLECDAEIERRAGMSIPDFINSRGEGAFRDAETEVISSFGRLSGSIISTGGGCILMEENYSHLHQNGIIVWIQRDIGVLPKSNRPLSQRGSLDAMYAQREPLYRRFADFTADNDQSLDKTLSDIKEAVL